MTFFVQAVCHHGLKVLSAEPCVGFPGSLTFGLKNQANPLGNTVCVSPVLLQNLRSRYLTLRFTLIDNLVIFAEQTPPFLRRLTASTDEGGHDSYLKGAAHEAGSRLRIGRALQAAEHSIPTVAVSRISNPSQSPGVVQRSRNGKRRQPFVSVHARREVSAVTLRTRGRDDQDVGIAFINL